MGWNAQVFWGGLEPVVVVQAYQRWSKGTRWERVDGQNPVGWVFQSESTERSGVKRSLPHSVAIVPRCFDEFVAEFAIIVKIGKDCFVLMDTSTLGDQ